MEGCNSGPPESTLLICGRFDRAWVTSPDLVLFKRFLLLISLGLEKTKQKMVAYGRLDRTTGKTDFERSTWKTPIIRRVVPCNDGVLGWGSIQLLVTRGF